MFIQPTHIPIPFAMAVYRVLHDQASVWDWTLFDQTGHWRSLLWYREILQANGTSGEQLKRECRWFWSELKK